MRANPYADERMARIYARAYAGQRNEYAKMESLRMEMELVYGRLSAALDGMDKPRRGDARSSDLTNPTSPAAMTHAGLDSDWLDDSAADDATSSSASPQP